jgi:hypothetical protein
MDPSGLKRNKFDPTIIPVQLANSWVHPNLTVGRKQIGDALAGLIQFLR